MKPTQFSAFAALARHANRNHWFDCFWQEVVPATLSSRVRVLNVRDAVLVLAATDAASATQARFQAPSWISALNTAARSKNLESIARIEVRVISAPEPRRRRAAPPAQLSPATRQHLLEVAEHLDNPRLAQAFRRLAQVQLAQARLAQAEAPPLAQQKALAGRDAPSEGDCREAQRESKGELATKIQG